MFFFVLKEYFNMLSPSHTLELIQHVLEEMKAQNIIKIDVSQKTSIADYMFICTGRASRHVLAIADELYSELKKAGVSHVRLSGTESGEWALMDCGDVIVHIMQPETRAYYNLEEIWQDSASQSNHA
ncbi:MAG: ribosome-associated protein [Pseudomonadota bacterium]|nr:ribosome-associated protein [Pseudomonadota bacterium]